MSGLTFQHRYEPPDRADRAETVLLLHGTGGNENDLLPVGRAVAPGAGLLSPRGQVLENGMPRFFRRLAEGVFDHEDLVARTHQLADFVAAAAKHYQFDPTRVTAAGFSNGANIASAMMLLRPETLAGAILLRPMVPFVPDQAPRLNGRRVLIAGGRSDPMVPIPQVEQLAVILGDAGAEVTVHWSPSGHILDRADLQAALSWWGAGVA